MGEAVFLGGSPSEVGTLQGQEQAVFLRERIARIQRRAQETSRQEELQERAARFAAVLRAVTPHWLEEAEAQAQAAHIPVDGLLALNCLPSGFWGAQGEAFRNPPFEFAEENDQPLSGDLIDVYEAQGIEPGMGGGECTTFFALGDATLSGETILHKNRDERDEVQWLGIKKIGNFYQWAGGGDIGNLGIAHVHTENFWAGANNTGSPLRDTAEREDCALADTHVLRYLSETCQTLDDIVPAVQKLISHSWLGGAGSGINGNIWVFADVGRGLIVEATSRRCAHRWFEPGDTAVRTNHFLLPEMQQVAAEPRAGSVQRYERATELWEALHGLAGISNALEIGRDRANIPHAICREVADGTGDLTVSTSTATISVHDDRRCQTHFRNGHPRYTPVAILTPLDKVCDSELLSGRHNAHWRRYRAAHQTSKESS